MMLALSVFTIGAALLEPRAAVRSPSVGAVRSASPAMILGFGKKEAAPPPSAAGLIVPTAAYVQAAVAEVVTEQEVRFAQASWASAIKSISQAYLNRGDFVSVAADAAAELYGYGHSNAHGLGLKKKPTKCALP
mmetsp:Transcript_3366/g.7235  ORF Transcript_3366/g.7235 Transcript_3366/m.7235 type:complete len:134 (-) Transcript_3366:130-531(-)